ncbi:MAG: hypothetical protein V4449_03350 [Patescibacteria group bacterium]
MSIDGRFARGHIPSPGATLERGETVQAIGRWWPEGADKCCTIRVTSRGRTVNLQFVLRPFWDTPRRVDNNGKMTDGILRAALLEAKKVFKGNSD